MAWARDHREHRLIEEGCGQPVRSQDRWTLFQQGKLSLLAGVILAGAVFLACTSLANKRASLRAWSGQNAEELLGLGRCEDFPQLIIKEVLHNNLGGMGPDSGPEGLVYKVSNYHGRHMDMVLHALNDDYKAQAPEKIGINGIYGSLNVAYGSHLELDVSFRNHETKKPVTLPKFAMTFYDVDTGPHFAGKERIQIEGGWSNYLLSRNSSINATVVPGTQKVIFTATEAETEYDSPKDPNHLHMYQFNKAVSVRFVDIDSFKVSLSLLNPSAGTRLFHFTARSALLCARREHKGTHPPLAPLVKNSFEHAPPGLTGAGKHQVLLKTSKKYTLGHWVVKEGDAVSAGDVIFTSITKSDNFVVPDGVAGILSKILPDVHHSNIVEKEVGVAIIDIGEVHELRADKDYTFFSWKVQEGETIDVGTPIFNASGTEDFKSTMHGKLVTLLEEERNMNVSKGAVIATVLASQQCVGWSWDFHCIAANPGKSGWLLLLLIAWLTPLLVYLHSKKEDKTQPALNAPKSVREALRGEYTGLASEAHSTQPSEPSSLPAAAEMGHRACFEFKLPGGAKRPVEWVGKPFGLTFHKQLPLVVERVHDEAKHTGVQHGWTLTQYGPAPDKLQQVNIAKGFDRVCADIHGLIDTLPDLKCMICVFRAPDGKEKHYTWWSQPLGLTLHEKTPIVIDKVHDEASHLGVEPGYVLTQVGHDHRHMVAITDSMTFEEVWDIIQKLMEILPQANP